MNSFCKISICISSLLLMTSAVQAARPGAYAGLGLGYSRLETPKKFRLGNDPIVVNHNVILTIQDQVTQFQSIGGLGGRIFTGFNFNENFGLEAGLSSYAKSAYTLRQKAQITTSNDFFTALQDVSVIESIKYTAGAVDLVGKAYLPLSNSGFNLYALGGAAIIMSKVDVKADALVAYQNAGGQRKGSSEISTGNIYTLRPIIGVGASYDIPDSPVSTRLELTHIDGQGQKSLFPSANMLTLNVSYNFG